MNAVTNEGITANNALALQTDQWLEGPNTAEWNAVRGKPCRLGRVAYRDGVPASGAFGVHCGF
jgi:hypothetical protein